MIIRPKDKEIIINLALKNIKTPCKLLAYGSRVSGEAHDTSDLDMVLVSDDGKKIDINEIANFKESLQESNIPILTQVFDWNRLPEKFHQNILDNCEEIVRIERVG
jgi:predicted nucleotidyltransferase